MKTIKKLVMIIILLFFLAFQVFSRDRIVDNARLLNNSQKSDITKIIDSVSILYNFDLVIVTEIDIGNKRPMDYADDFYDYNGYGFGRNNDGCLLLQVTGSKNYCVTTCGRGIELLDSFIGEKLSNDIVKFLTEDNPYEAYRSFINNWEIILRLEKNNILISSNNLINEYFSNIMRADNNYKGKNLAIAGTITNIRQDSSGEYFIEMNRYIYIYFQGAEVQKIINLSIGNHLYIIGRCDGTNGSSTIFIRNSIIFEGIPGIWQAELVQPQSFIDWSDPLAQITRNFTVHEATFLPSWGIYHIPTADEKENIIELAVALQRVRDAYGSSMNIEVWIRPTSVNPGILDSSGKIVSSPSNPRKGQNYNAAIGSSATSHISGKAVDIKDANRSLTNFLLKNQQLLIDNNLWMEDEKFATTYVHLDVITRPTTGRTKGRERIFIP